MPNSLSNISPNALPKTVLLAIATLMLAVAALVTNVVRPYTGSTDSAISATAPAQSQSRRQVQPQLRPQPRPQTELRMQA